MGNFNLEESLPFFIFLHLFPLSTVEKNLAGLSMFIHRTFYVNSTMLCSLFGETFPPLFPFFEERSKFLPKSWLVGVGWEPCNFSYADVGPSDDLNKKWRVEIFEIVIMLMPFVGIPLMMTVIYCINYLLPWW